MKEKEMSKNPEIRISINEPSKENNNIDKWGEFVYEAKMPWGPWHLTRKPREIFKSENIMVLECFADEYIEDEYGYVPERTLENDPCSRQFLVGQTKDGNILWWYNFGTQRYDLKNHRFYEASTKIKGKEFIIKGYGWEVEPDDEVHVDMETGTKTIVKAK